MEYKRIRYNYSYIGNFVDFLIGNEQRIKNLMTDYEIQSRVEQLEDGREIKSLLFTKQNVTVRFLPSRIDYVYNLPNMDFKAEDVFTEAKAFYKILSEIFYDLNAQRIAIVGQGFIENENNKAIEDFTSKMKFVETFGEANELSFKINNPIQAFERLNSVLDIQMGTAKNNKTQEVVKVLLVSIDVNTLAENKEPRFNPNNFELDFEELFEEVELKYLALKKY